jgi:hypothetical protein
MARRYVLAMLGGAVAAIAAAGALSWFIDPLGIYGSPRVQGLNALKPALKGRVRIAKTLHVANDGWDCIVVGTSRGEAGIDTGHPYFRATPCFNAAQGGQHYEESRRLVDAAIHRGGLRRVVAMLDFEVANAHYEGPTDFDPGNYRPWRRALLALNLELIEQALYTPMRQDADVLRRDHALWFPDGRFDFPPPPRGHRALALASEAGYFTKALFRGPRHEFALATPASRPLEHLRGIAAQCSASGVELVLVVAPTHARQLEAISAAGLWPEFESWKRSLVAINEEEAARTRKPPFVLWDFSGYSEITTEPFPPVDDTHTRMRWYFESSHFTPAAGDRMLDRIAGGSDPGFGTRLTSDMLEAHLDRIRAARLSWRASHPVDAAEVEGLASQFGARNGVPRPDGNHRGRGEERSMAADAEVDRVFAGHLAQVRRLVPRQDVAPLR